MKDLVAVRYCFNKTDIGTIFNTKLIKELVNIKYGKKLDTIIQVIIAITSPIT